MSAVCISKQALRSDIILVTVAVGSSTCHGDEANTRTRVRKMAKARCVIVISLFCICSTNLLATNADTSGETDGNIPGIAFEFKVHVDAGKEHCFYQYVEPSANLFVAFQVIRGGDSKAGFAVRHPHGHHVHPYQWKAESEYEEVSQSGGIYEICIDNQFSRFASKLVLLYITSFQYDRWENFTAELEQLDISVANFTASLRVVGARIGEIQRNQQYGRRHEVRDYQLLLANNKYVQNWSIAQCVVVIVASSLQVFFVRKLFDVKSVTPTSKPRA